MTCGWRSLDFYEALVLYRDGQHVRARQLAENARALFARASVPARAALCDLLLARLELQAGNLQAAEGACHAVFERTAGAETPILTYQAHFVLGLVREAQGDRDAALEAFQKAHAALEQLRSRLQGDDLKVAFLEDKQAVYESLVSTCLALGPTARAAGGGVRLHRKGEIAQPGRSDRVSRRLAGAAGCGQGDRRGAPTPSGTELALSAVGTGGNQRARNDRPRRMESLRQRARALEKQLSRSLDELRRTDEEFSALQSGASFGLEEIRVEPRARHDPPRVLPGPGADLCLCSRTRSARHRAAGAHRAGAESPATAAIPALEVPSRTGPMSARSPSSCRRRPRRTFASFMRAHRADPRSAARGAPGRGAARRPAFPAVSRAARRRALSDRRVHVLLRAELQRVPAVLDQAGEIERRRPDHGRARCLDALHRRRSPSRRERSSRIRTCFWARKPPRINCRAMARRAGSCTSRRTACFVVTTPCSRRFGSATAR